MKKIQKFKTRSREDDFAPPDFSVYSQHNSAMNINACAVWETKNVIIFKNSNIIIDKAASCNVY